MKNVQYADSMQKYDHKKIEKKWQERWAKERLYETKEDADKEKTYVLDMFPYPSGEGLHVGHPKGYIATDVYARMKRMQGQNILHPMGWDAFGLPAENYAIKNKVHPRIAVEKNIERFKEQLSVIGLDYDWSREINTTDPNYYKWTQWIFLKLLEKGLAYQSYEPINWCPSCQTGLANEDLEEGKCERCGSEVELRPMRQWVLKITEYADRLLNDLEKLSDWPEHIKEQQRNWIGRSEGVILEFPISNFQFSIKVFTTRADTLFGATYMVLAPEHPLVEQLKSSIKNWGEAIHYIGQSKKKTELERTAEGKEKTGVELKGIKAVNPGSKEEIPVFIADYVLAHYGTGAIMAVPAHDERDFAFAESFRLPIHCVVEPPEAFVAETGETLQEAAENTKARQKRVLSGMEVYTDPGFLVNSENFTGLSSEEAKKKIVAAVSGEKKVTYKLRDWVFSRQRYWGEPIPIIHCEKCGVVPVSEEDLPVLLPEVEHYEPTGTGASPLENIEEWMNVPCPKCGGEGKRETNTMPQWAGSSWYWLRFMDPSNERVLVSKEKEKMWGPVDVYVGGDHAVRHLIYARFWHKFLYDIDIVSTEEPFTRLEYLGFILAEDGRKMSKRLGNVINPDDIVKRFGADSFRLYEMFMGPFENTTAWSTDNLVGVRRFLERVWRSAELVQSEPIAKLEPKLHQTIKKVGNDIEAFKFNTTVSQMMIFLNEVEKARSVGEEQLKRFLKVLAPFAPHITEELWELLGEESSVHLEAWPVYDEEKIATTEVTIAVQVNGKLRGELTVRAGSSKEEVEAKACKLPAVLRWLQDAAPSKVIYVENRLINLVV